MKQMKVDAIKNGTVIDHIPAGKVLQVVEILNVKKHHVMMIGMNLHSNKVGKKDILKIENHFLSQEEVNSIALIAPSATLTIIRDFEIIRKTKVEIPKFIENIITCPNPKCITNSEKIKTKFTVSEDESLSVRCFYCEKKYKIEEVRMEI
ncbi:MAG: aspartate carbamoyltransferase regulatory subunit [Candidatus Cloacimonadota bacterium]|nr:MAG: aspartate carbamoyltransferase regulatory subunit [Candidatus Cloacimonadota bacterium]